MYGIIGEVSKFILNKNKAEFIEYSLSFPEMVDKLKTMDCVLLNTEHNMKVKQMIINNEACDSLTNYENKLLGVEATYYDSILGVVQTGELSTKKLHMALNKRAIKYCFIGADNEVQLSEGLPEELIERRDNPNNKKVVTLCTSLYFEVGRKGKKTKIAITAKFRVGTLGDNEQSEDFPAMYGSLEKLHNEQEEMVHNYRKTLFPSIQENKAKL